MPEPLSMTPEQPQFRASSAEMVPMSIVRCFQSLRRKNHHQWIYWVKCQEKDAVPVCGDQVLHLVQALAELGDEVVDVIQETDGDVLQAISTCYKAKKNVKKVQYLVDSARPDVCGVHPGPRGPLVELHHLLPLLEEPEEGREAADVQDVGADAHQVVQDASQLAKHD